MGQATFPLIALSLILLPQASAQAKGSNLPAIRVLSPGTDDRLTGPGVYFAFTFDPPASSALPAAERSPLCFSLDSTIIACTEVDVEAILRDRSMISMCVPDVAPGTHDLHVWWRADSPESDLPPASAARAGRVVVTQPDAPVWLEPQSRRACGVGPDESPCLIQVPDEMGAPRFVPETRQQRMAAVFALWNLLDRAMERRIPAQERAAHHWVYGYVRPAQAERIVGLVLEAEARLAARGLKRPAVYCEIGFNGGHSAAAVLQGTTARVHAFDVQKEAYSADSAALVSLAFPGRFFLDEGDSAETVPKFAETVGAVCDVLMVDGDHAHAAARADIRNGRSIVVPCGHAVVLDDVAASPAAAALADAEADGEVEVLERHLLPPHHPENARMRTMETDDCTGRRVLPHFRWGWALGRYKGLCAAGEDAEL
jgi:hypothetical protein